MLKTSAERHIPSLEFISKEKDQVISIDPFLTIIQVIWHFPYAPLNKQSVLTLSDVYNEKF